MIKIKQDIIDKSCDIHESELTEKLFQKCQLLKKIILKLIECKNDIESYKDWFDNETEDFNKKQVSVNFGLKTGKKIRSSDDLDHFKNQDNWDIELTDITKNAIVIVTDFLTKEKLKSLMTETPKNLNDINSELMKKAAKQNQVLVKKVLEFMLNYEEFTIKGSNYDAYQLTSNLKVEACLYCNRNFIQTISSESHKIIRPELDHFFPKKDFPLLRLSFYNLIPSCHICNSNLKGSDDFDHEKAFHPYLGSFDDYAVYFTYKPNNVNAFTTPEFKDFDIRVNYDDAPNVSIKSRIKKNVECFRLDEIYNYNKTYALEIKEIADITNENYIKSIKEEVMIDGEGNPIFKSDEEVYKRVMFNYYNPEEYFKRPLAKFIKDLMVEFKLIKR